MARRKPNNKRSNYTSGRPGEKGEKYHNSSSKEGIESPSDGKGVEGKDSKEEATMQKTGNARSTNDPEWYAVDPQLLLDAASLNYSDPLGQPITYDNPNQVIYPTGEDSSPIVINPQYHYNSHAVAGICTLVMKHSIGTSLTRNDPANVAASAFYSFVRYVNSGRKNYDPADLWMYALAIGDLYAFIQWMKRCYGYAFIYSQLNQYIGKALLDESAVNADNVINNLANFRYYINAFINKVSSFVIPSNVPYFMRRRFMYDGLYLENPYNNLKDQLYQFNPEGFYKFNLDPDGKGMLTWKFLTRSSTGRIRAPEYGDTLTVTDIINFGNDLLTNIMGDEDFGLMSGDILKAYGANVMSLEPLPEDYFVLPHYDMTVLSQFKNATIASSRRAVFDAGETYPAASDPTDNSYKYGNIYQDKVGNILCREGIAATSGSGTTVDQAEIVYSLHMMKLLSQEMPMPGPADNMEASRLSIVADSQRFIDSKHMLNFNCGVDYATEVRLRGNKIFTTPYRVGYVAISLSQNGLTATQIANTPELQYFISQFKYMPILFEMTITGDSSGGWSLDGCKLISNVDNYTVINKTVLDKMHECALLSLFYVPGVAKYVNHLG